MTPRTDPSQSATPVFRRYGWWFAGLAALAAIVGLAALRHPHRQPQRDPAAGYQADAQTLAREYRKFHGKLLRDPELEQQFIRAAGEVSQKNYPAAIAILEAVAREAAVPIIFHDLGELYAAVGDRARAIETFREALARDAMYRPVRDSIDRMKWIEGDQAEPLRHEMEPNNSTAVANVIAVGTPAEGELTVGDIDTFKFITPASPRDIVQLDISNLTPTLELGIRVSDSEMKNEAARVLLAAGESLTRYIEQPPNTPLYLQLWGAHDTTGSYRVSVQAMKRFDEFEPNDDIFSARRIEPGASIEANIMDGDDTDFYVFESPRTGRVEIEIRNHSPSLIPALTTFGSDKRNTGFGPDVRTPGANLRHTLDVQEHQTYYLQVWSQAMSAGSYSLTVK